MENVLMTVIEGKSSHMRKLSWLLCFLLMPAAFIGGIYTHKWWVNEKPLGGKLYDEGVIDSEKMKVANGFYEQCKKNAVEVGQYGKLGVCFESAKGYRDSFWMIVYDSTGQIQLNDKDYCTFEDGKCKQYKGYKRASEWYEAAGKVRGKWNWEDFDKGPISLGKGFYYMVNEIQITSSAF